MFARRLGQAGIKACEGGHYCPQILELLDKDIAVVGKPITAEAVKAMPPGPGVGPDETVVRIPRQTFAAAIADFLAAAK